MQMHTLLANLPSAEFEDVMPAYVQIEQHMTQRHCNCWVIYGNPKYAIRPKLYGYF